jgi:predicted PurR-regulated permease PerM
MNFGDHVRTTGGALKNWFIAQTQDALAVAAMWLIGLWFLHVPLWFIWVPMAFVLQYVPQFGTMLALLGPALSAAFSGGWMRFIYVLIVYAVIVIVEGLIIQPLLMKRAAKVPFWASLIVPIVMGFVIPFWGVLLAPPLLAIFFTYWNRRKQVKPAGN